TRADMPIGATDRVQPIPVVQLYRPRAPAQGDREAQVIARREEPGRRLKARLGRKEPFWQAGIGNTVFEQAVLEYPRAYSRGAHALSKSGIVRTGGIRDHDESS